MKQRGRKSAAALAVPSVNGKGPRLEPPASLSKAERSVFVGLVTACDPDHFRASDLPLLVRYTESIVLADRAALELRKGAVVKGKSSPWLRGNQGNGGAVHATALVTAEPHRSEDIKPRTATPRSGSLGDLTHAQAKPRPTCHRLD
jgi:hypothetical protein